MAACMTVRRLDAEIEAGGLTMPSGSPQPLVPVATKIAGEVLAPGIRSNLEKLLDKSESPEEKQRALDLLTNLELSEDQRPRKVRPKTAMAAVGRSYDALLNPKSVFNPYETSYKYDFPRRPFSPTRADRPPTATNAVLPQPGLGRFGITHYVEEFRNKGGNRSSPIRAGTSSGVRSNNPHPQKEFLVWRYPRGSSADLPKENMDLDIDQQMMITGEEFDRVVRGKCRSIYQSDFAGLPQGADVTAAFADLPDDPRGRLRYSKESTNRIVHAPPSPLPHELRVPTTRFGAKKDRNAAYGTLPGVVSNTQMNLVSRTTYDRDLNDRATFLYGIQKPSASSRVVSFGPSLPAVPDGGGAANYGSDPTEVTRHFVQSPAPISSSRSSSTGGSHPDAHLGLQVGRPHVTWAPDVVSARPRARTRRK